MLPVTQHSIAKILSTIQFILTRDWMRLISHSVAVEKGCESQS